MTNIYFSLQTNCQNVIFISWNAYQNKSYQVVALTIVNDFDLICCIKLLKTELLLLLMTLPMSRIDKIFYWFYTRRLILCLRSWRSIKSPIWWNIILMRKWSMVWPDDWIPATRLQNYVNDVLISFRNSYYHTAVDTANMARQHKYVLIMTLLFYKILFCRKVNY